MAVAVINGCEKLTLSDGDYQLLLLCMRCGDFWDCGKAVEELCVDLV